MHSYHALESWFHLISIVRQISAYNRFLFFFFYFFLECHQCIQLCLKSWSTLEWKLFSLEILVPQSEMFSHVLSIWKCCIWKVILSFNEQEKQQKREKYSIIAYSYYSNCHGIESLYMREWYRREKNTMKTDVYSIHKSTQYSI